MSIQRIQKANAAACRAARTSGSIGIDQSREVVFREEGFESWTDFRESIQANSAVRRKETRRARIAVQNAAVLGSSWAG